jgi:hypothetical protein
MTPVTGHTSDRITLEFGPGEPIQGRLLDQSGAEHVFRGWLELCAALDRAWQQAGMAIGSQEAET